VQDLGVITGAGFVTLWMIRTIPATMKSTTNPSKTLPSKDRNPAFLTIATALVVPVGAATLVAARDRAPKLREMVTLVAAGALFVAVASLLQFVLSGERPSLRLVEIFRGLALEFRVAPLGLLFALIASGRLILSSLYSIGYMRGNAESHQTRLDVCLRSRSRAPSASFSSVPTFIATTRRAMPDLHVGLVLMFGALLMLIKLMTLLVVGYLV
jgi:hypothetical protein